MTLVGLDISSSRARAVGGARAQVPVRLSLDGPRADLPLALSLEGRAPAVGRAGLVLARARPHVAVLDFLPHLGTSRQWAGPSLKTTANEALQHVLATLHKAMGRANGLVFSVPGYLDEMQVYQAHRLADEAHLPVLGTVQAPLAALVAQVANSPFGPHPGLVLVVDCDGYALTWSIIDCAIGRCGTRLVRASPHLGRTAWVRRLLDGAALRFIRQSRRDPRDNALTEQALYEQLLAVLEGSPSAPLVPLGVQGEGWSHHLLLPADDLCLFAQPLLHQAMVELDGLLAEVAPLGGIQSALVTASAAGLPGLVSLLKDRIQPTCLDDDSDYGEAMLTRMSGEPVCVLPADALAQACHELAVRMASNALPKGHLEELAFAGPGGGPPDPGPPRLHYRGREHHITRKSFLLGRDPSCDLVFETGQYPHVSARHCEIIFDRRHYTLHDRSRYGTLLNDRLVNQQAPLHSGDWIRLGPQGPVLRFIGQGKPA